MSEPSTCNWTKYRRTFALFLRDQIDSYEQLDILLLLWCDSLETWTADDLAIKLNISEPLTAAALTALCARQLIVMSSHVPEARYTRGSAESYETVRRLQDIYVARPIEIIKLMSAQAIERVRTAALRRFVDAFLFRRGKGNG